MNFLMNENLKIENIIIQIQIIFFHYKINIYITIQISLNN